MITDFLTAYELYTSGTEASPNYHKWCGLSVLASVMSRRIWIMQGRIRVNPNLYIILVGDPAEGKSLAMLFAKTLVGELSRRTPSKHPFIVSGSITKEALTLAMGTQPNNSVPSGCQQTVEIDGKIIQYSHVSVFANEVVTFLGDAPMKMIDFMTDIYDRDDFPVITKNKGNDLIEGPFINFLGGLTPNTLNGLSQQKLITGGFTRRCNFIYAEGRGSIDVARPTMTPEQVAAYKTCVDLCLDRAKIKGEFRWTRDTEIFFDEWYARKNRTMREQNSIAMRGYYRSLDQMLLRVGMLVSISEGNSLTLTVDHLKTGLRILDGLDVYLDKTFSGSGRNELAAITTQMVEYLAKQDKPVLRKKLQNMFWADAKTEDFNTCIAHLTSVGTIKSLNMSGAPGQPPIEYIELLSK